MGATFELAGDDPDGDPLSWSLDFGDGSATATGSGVDLPAFIEHDYGAAGNYTATWSLSDGQDDVTYTAVVEIA